MNERISEEKGLPPGWTIKQLTRLELIRHAVDEHAETTSPEVTIGVLREEIKRLEMLTGGDER